MIRGLGFMPGSFTGRTRLGYASGSPAHGLGDLPGDAATAVAIGLVDQQTMDYLLASGVTDDQVIAFINGQIDLPSLMQAVLQKPFAQQAGIQMNYEPTSWASYGVETALDSLNSDISQLETWASESTAVKNDIGTQIQAARAQWNSWHAQYQNWVNQTDAPEELTMPDGSKVITDRVYQASLNPYVIVTVAAIVALASAIAYYHTQTVNGLIERAKADMAATGMQQMAIDQAAKLAATNPQLASDILKTAQNPAGQNPAGQPQPPKPPGGGLDWLTQNKSLVIGLVALVFVAPPLLAAFGGSRRR